MISVLLVDDDYLVRMYLRQLIDWEKEGFLLVGDACNGEEALDMMEKMPVQLLLTDISMPVLDGIALIRRVKERQAPPGIVVLSCHDEFTYVKEAMQLGADEYVLKNDLTADGLRRMLVAMKERIAATRAQQSEQLELWKLAQKGSEQLKEEALRQLFDREWAFEEQTRLLKEHTWTGTYYSAGAIVIDLQRQRQVDTLVQVCRQVLRDTACEFFVMDEAVAVVAVDLSDTVPSTQWSQLQHLASRIAQTAEQYAAADPCVAVSRIYSSDGGITKALREAVGLLEYGFYGHRLCLPDAAPLMVQALPEDAATLFTGPAGPADDSDALGGRYRSVLEQIREHPVEPPLVREWIAALDEAWGLSGEDPPRTLLDCEQRLNRYRERWRILAAESAIADNPAVVQAARYIREHFAQPLTLTTVADAVHLNSAYLSHIFKKEMEISFSEYLLQQRMEYVKDALKKSARPAKEIALEGGFTDYRHFSKLFKKQTGLRPAEWRRGACRHSD